MVPNDFATQGLLREIILDELQCSGTELELTECQHNSYYQHSCNPYDAVGVVCGKNSHYMTSFTLSWHIQ